MRYNRKNAYVRAIQFTGKNAHEVAEFVVKTKIENPYELAAGIWIKQSSLPDETGSYRYTLIIKNNIEAHIGDWIIEQPISGTIFVMSEDEFNESYEESA